jgi:hypothetical protein
MFSPTANIFAIRDACQPTSPGRQVLLERGRNYVKREETPSGDAVARFFPLPGDDREQGVRFRRYLIAVGTSLTVVLLLGVCVLAGALAPRPFAIAAGIALVSIASFYLVFRSGLNRRARDPSLTVPMMLAAICVVTYALYHLGAVRTVFLLIYPMIILVGRLRRQKRQ